MNAQPQSGAVVLSDDLKNPAMEKLDLVRKWSINTYKVILSVLDLFLCPSSTLLLLSAFVPLFIFSQLLGCWQESELYPKLSLLQSLCPFYLH